MASETTETELTYAEIASHDTKQDLYMVIHDNIYSVGKFVDEHPGGEEVLMDVAGQDATEAFEDVGHSDEAREILAGLKVGILKRGENDPKPASYASNVKSPDSEQSGGIPSYVFAILFALVGAGAYYYTQLQAQQKSS